MRLERTSPMLHASAHASLSYGAPLALEEAEAGDIAGRGEDDRRLARGFRRREDADREDLHGAEGRVGSAERSGASERG